MFRAFASTLWGMMLLSLACLPVIMATSVKTPMAIIQDERLTTTTSSLTLPTSNNNNNTTAKSSSHRRSLHKFRKKCGTHDFSATTMHRMMDIITAKNKKKGKVLETTATIVVNTHFIIVTDDLGNGDAPDAALAQQIAELNRNFAAVGSKFRFRRASTQRVQITDATTVDLDTYINELGQYRRGGFDALNFFIVPNQVNAGVAYPWFELGLYELDGVYILRDYISDGDYGGLTAVHEIGHWLGLPHTFQTLSPYSNTPCNANNPNDYISDTPQMARATPFYLGCPIQRDTCPGRPGLDPTKNFMDYGDDYDDTTGVQCHTEFTPEQIARMTDIWYYYRVLNEICAANELQVLLQLRFDADPGETLWNITLPDGTLVHESLVDRYGYAHSDDFANKQETINFCLIRQRYVFHLYDTYGDGILSPGYYKLTVDGTLIAQGGPDFYEKAIPFGSGVAKPTRKPTRKPTKKPTRKPTRKPT